MQHSEYGTTRKLFSYRRIRVHFCAGTQFLKGSLILPTVTMEEQEACALYYLHYSQ